MNKYLIIAIIIAIGVVLLLPSATSSWSTSGPTWQNTTSDNITTNWDDGEGITILGQYSDEFNTGSLDTDVWWWVREDDWIMGDTYVQINSTDTDMYQDTETAPILLRNITNEDLTIITNISCAPNQNYEGGGLIFYADDDNFVAFMYFYSSGSLKVITKKEDNNVQVYDTSDGIGAINPLYLKLEKSGTLYTSYYSSDRTSWTEHFNYSISDTMTDAGIIAYGSGSADPEPFRFDFLMTDNFTRNGNMTVTYDAGTNNVVSGYNINLNTPTNSNISISYKDNDTSAERVLGTGITDESGWINASISGDLYQDVNLILTLVGNTTTSPIIELVTLQTEITTLDDPTDLANTTGDYWANFTWTEPVDVTEWEVMISEE